MKFNQWTLSTISVLLCTAIGCSKMKDDGKTPQENSPVKNTTNNSTATKNNSLTPNIAFTDFAPANGFIGDTITLTGNNLDESSLKVTFNYTPATIVSRSANQIQVVVPDDIMEANEVIRLSTADTTVSSTQKFSLNAPIITSFSPTIGFPGQKIIVTGKGFRDSRTIDQVAFGDGGLFSASFITPGHTTLTIPGSVGWKAGKYNISVTIAGLKTVAAQQFEMLAPTIQSVNTTTAPIGSEVIIDGDNFIDPNGGVTEVTFHDVKTDIKIKVLTLNSLTNNQLKFTVPKVTLGSYKIKVRVLGAYVYHTTPLTIVK